MQTTLNTQQTTTLVVIVWFIGAMIAYNITRKWNKRQSIRSGNTYGYSHVAGNLVAGALSWVVVVIVGMLYVIAWLVEADFGEPPKWL